MTRPRAGTATLLATAALLAAGAPAPAQPLDGTEAPETAGEAAGEAADADALGGADQGLPQSALALVSAVYSGHSLRLVDGREVVLPHVMPPGADRYRPLEDRRFDRRATEALADLVLARQVRIDLAPIARDRRGRLRARLALVEGAVAGAEDVALTLVRHGMLRVMPEPGAEPGRIAALLAAEDDARTARRGFWRRYFKVRRAEPYDGETDRFQIVEGRVARVGRSGGRRYLEFGADWRTDFTAGVETRTLDDFAAAGIDIEELAGVRVRLRGWVRQWNGPFLDLDAPVQLERLGDE